jgi:aminoglycoside phosphotransferase (APT) family kinase protein
MMEDLYPARQGDQIAGCAPDQAAIAVTELAKLHAPRWNDPSLARIEWLNSTDPNAAAAGQTLYGQLVAGFGNRYRDRLEPAHMAVAEALAGRFARWAGGYSGPRAIVHGDYRLDNMLFGGRYPVAVVDWQTFSIGAPTSDLSYFIGAGLTPELRRLHERELVRRYHEELVGAGIESYPFDDCWRDYRRYAYSGLVMAVVASMIVGRTERGDAMFMAMASRHAQQALDLETDTLIDA